MRTGRRQRWWSGAGGLLGFLVVLELVPRAGLVPDRYLPPASRIAGALADELGQPAFWAALGDTLEGWAIGLAMAVGAGVGLGLLLGSVPALRAATSSTIEFLRPIPSVALIPLAVLLFGTDLRSKLLLVVYASFWQVLIQVLHGVQDVDPVAMDTAHSYGLGRWARIRHVAWPTALPYAVTGFRLAAAVALVLAITAELIIGSPGLGREIAVAQTSGAVPAMYALVVVAGLLGVGVNVVARALERRLLAWHPSTRRVLLTVGLPLALLALWWVASADSQSFYLPPLRQILEAFPSVWVGARLVDDVLPSLVRLLAGFALATVAGVGLGVVIGGSPRLRAALEPVLEFLRAIPPPVLVPILILVAGIGTTMKVLVIVSGCVWPVLLNTVEGVRARDEVLEDTCRVYGIRGWARLRHLVLRAASPQIVTGMRQALSIGIILMVISEMFAASSGLGFTIIQFQRSFAIPEMWSGILLLGLLGVALSLAFRGFEVRVLGWYHGLRRAQRGPS